MSVAAGIRRKLCEALKPTALQIIDESHLHAGHAAMANRAAVESHFRVEIESPMFQGKPLVARHQMVYELLAEELAGPVHALSLKTTLPSKAPAVAEAAVETSS